MVGKRGFGGVTPRKFGKLVFLSSFSEGFPSIFLFLSFLSMPVMVGVRPAYGGLGGCITLRLRISLNDSLKSFLERNSVNSLRQKIVLGNRINGQANLDIYDH